MKIGIVTIYHANMGSYFQATALLNYLKDKGYDCELVNASVRGKHMARYYMSEIGRKFLNKKILEKIEKKSRLLKLIIQYTKIWKICQFHHLHLV